VLGAGESEIEQRRGFCPRVADIGRTHSTPVVAGNGNAEVVKGVYMVGFKQLLMGWEVVITRMSGGGDFAPM
jgi:hypothetical protein